jgi:hypothetical protein
MKKNLERFPNKNMKKILLGIILILGLPLTSCEKDEVKAVLSPGSNLALTSTQSTLVLVQANAANTATSFAWDKASFGYDAGITALHPVDHLAGGVEVAGGGGERMEDRRAADAAEQTEERARAGGARPEHAE